MNMRKLALIICLVTVFACKSKKEAVQSAPPKPPDMVLFTFGSDTVYKSEFERIYSKNNTSKEQPDEKSIREYLDLYINFKLKVQEAKRLQLDTLPSFKSELAGYRKQLAQPYLIDKAVTDRLVNEAYERMKVEVNASHILFNCDEHATAKDTLAAYNKALEVRKEALKGTSFDSLAVKYSDDPSAKENHGNLGYFSAFQMIYQFESGAFNTDPGKISMPIRTRFGYHLIKVLDRRPARGEIKVAHIMIKMPSGGTEQQLQDVKNRVDSVYTKLKKGAKFEDLVKEYSQDESSARNNGEMPWFSGTSTYPIEFKDAAFALAANGDYSAPVKTQYGWHIIKRIDKREMQSLKELEESIKSKVNRDSRAEMNKTALVERVKKENGFKENPAAYKAFAAVVDSSILVGRWDRNKAKGLNDVMFSLKGKSFSQQDFADYVTENQAPRSKVDVATMLSTFYKEYIAVRLYEYEETSLDSRHEDFRNLMQEYHDGILLFDLTDKKVWSKAVTDTVGLQAFYESHKQNYMWKDRVAVESYTCADNKTAVEAEKLVRKGMSATDVLKKLNAKKGDAIAVKEGKYERGEQSKYDALFAMGKDAAGKVLAENGQVKADNPKAPADKTFKSFDYVRAVLPPQPKELKEVKGMMTSEYQNTLEKEWLQELRGRYPVHVMEPTVSKLFK